METKFTIPQLPYAMDSLAPVITEETLKYHYGKHLQTYIDNLNMLIEGTPFKGQPLEKIIKTSEGPIFNNAAQTFNHIFYFNNISPIGGGEPQGKLREAIERKWKSFDEFKKEFTQKAVGIFGSGWAWLQTDANGELSIAAESNAGTPIKKDLIPLMTMDVWEHAYYLDHQNRRLEYVNGMWDILAWRKIEEHYKF